MKKFLKCITIPLFCLFTGGALLPSARAIDTDKTLLSIVRIFNITEDGAGMGTGFIVNENGSIITNQHVVDGAKELYAFRYTQGVTRLFRCKCESAQQSTDLDLAVMSSSIKAPHLTLNTVEPKPTAVVYTAGFPAISDAESENVFEAFARIVAAHKNDAAVDEDGADVSREFSENKLLQDTVVASFSTGQVKRMANQDANVEGGAIRRMVDCNIPMWHGNSGGPLLDAAGYVIGVVGDVKGRRNFKTLTDKDGGKHLVTAELATMEIGIAEVELRNFLLARKIAFHEVAKKIGQWSTKQKILVSVAGACAVIAASLAFFLIPRQQPVAKSTPTVVIAEKMRRIMEEQGLVKPLDRQQPKVSVGSVWELDIQGPGGFRQNVRLTDADFKRGRGRVVVGRNSDFSDVLVKHDSVSRQHLHFEIGDSGIVVADRHSSNGTKVNGKSLGRPFRNQSLKEGDSIQFGELTASVRRGF